MNKAKVLTACGVGGRLGAVERKPSSLGSILQYCASSFAYRYLILKS